MDLKEINELMTQSNLIVIILLIKSLDFLIKTMSLLIFYKKKEVLEIRIGKYSLKKKNLRKTKIAK